MNPNPNCDQFPDIWQDRASRKTKQRSRPIRRTEGCTKRRIHYRE